MSKTVVVQVTADGQLEIPLEILSSLQPGDEYYLWQENDMIVLKKIQKPKGLSGLWQKLDELGTDSEQPPMEEITAMVKEVRHRLSNNESFT
jgi:bifunctional DNA-binding transcriptional regulator/antitoxin component of YhaV-PrlF toxin-antitoxin module